MAKAQDTLDALKAQVDQSNTVMGGAVTLINGFGSRMDKAVQDALANGASEAQLAPITDEIATLKANADALATAVQSNTPADPNGPPAPTPPVDPNVPPGPPVQQSGVGQGGRRTRP